jgi:hypothetical protein
VQPENSPLAIRSPATGVVVYPDPSRRELVQPENSPLAIRSRATGVVVYPDPSRRELVQFENSRLTIRSPATGAAKPTFSHPLSPHRLQASCSIQILPAENLFSLKIVL